MNSLQGVKDGFQKQVGDRQAEGKQMRQDLNKMKKNLGYTSEDQIEERIATIEFQMWTQSLSLKDEKKYLAEIQELKRTRPKVSQYHKMEADVANFDVGMNIREQVGGVNEQMAAHRDSKKEIQ